jgi:uncharacterized protein (PEP-CTERM system associated)
VTVSAVPLPHEPGRRRRHSAPGTAIGTTPLSRAGALLAGALGLGLSLPASAQGVLPAPGVESSLGDLRQMLSRAFQVPNSVEPPDWSTSEAIDVSELWTDNAPNNTLTGQHKGDFATMVTPSIDLQANTSRLQGSLHYAPTLSIWAHSPSQDSVSQTFDGNIHATLIEDTLFLNATGAVFNQSLNGGVGNGDIGNGSIVPLSRQDTVNTESYSIAPYFQHRFGGTGVLEAGYSMAQTFQSGQGALIVSPFSSPVPAQPLTSNNEHVIFTTGEDFGRLSNTVEATATENTGGGVLSNSHQILETWQAGYAVIREFSVLGEIGHEDISYGGTHPIHIDDAVWNGGFQWRPNPDSTLTVTYGHQDGAESIFVDGSLAPTPRTRVTLRYSEGLDTAQQDLENTLAAASFDSTGQAIDTQTGTPLALANNFLGTSGDLVRLKRASATLSWLLDRDTFFATAEVDDSKVISQAVATGASSGSSATASLAWQHEISDALSSSVYLSYGVRTANGGISTNGGISRWSQDTFSAGATLSYAISETLSVRGQVYLVRSTANIPGFASSSDTVIVGVHKSF